MYKGFIFVLLCGALGAQIPTPEDLETKSARDPNQEGLEMREVRESGAKDVGEALSHIAGLWKIRKGAIANDVVLRGFQSGNLNVLIDGARIFGACPGHMDPAAFHVDFAEVDRIEVTKGGFDVLNEGSLGGSVNIIRKRPGSGLHITPSFQIGSFGYYNPSVVGSFGTEKVEFLAGYSERRSLPYEDGTGRRITTIGGYRPEFARDDAFRIQTGWTNFRFSPVRNQSGELSYTRQQGDNILYPYLQMDAPYDNADRLGANYEFRDLGAAVHRLRVQSYYSRVRHWMTDEKRQSAVGALAAFSMATFAKTRAAGGRVDVELAHGFQAGFEAFGRNWDAVNSMRTRAMNMDQNLVPNVDTNVAGAYVEFARSLSDRVRVGAGARFDTAHMFVRSSNVNRNLFQAYHGTSDLDRRDSNPSGNVRISTGLTHSLELFAGGASSVRIPDAQERFYNQTRMGSDWVGNPGLVATRNHEANLGLSFRRRNFYVKPLLFFNALQDYVTVHDVARLAMLPGVMNTTARSYDNVDARMWGGEVAYGASLGSRWLLSGGLSATRGSRNAVPVLGIVNTNVPEMPPLRGHSALRYGRRLWFAQVEGIAAGRQAHVDTSLREAPTSGYAVMNAKFGIHFKSATLTAGLDNAFNRYYYEHFSFQRDPYRNGQRVPEPGRSLFLNMSYAF